MELETAVSDVCYRATSCEIAHCYRETNLPSCVRRQWGTMDRIQSFVRGNLIFDAKKDRSPRMSKLRGNQLSEFVLRSIVIAHALSTNQESES